MVKLKVIPITIAVLICMLMATGSMAAPSKGVIYVNSDPVGAEIYLTNTSVSPDNLTVHDTGGITPREFFVDPGVYRLFLKKYGYITWWNESFEVLPGTFHDFNVSLTETNPQFGAIHINSRPTGANLVLQRFIPNVTSVIYSSTPASVESLPPGVYNYTITMDGYYDYEGSTEVTAGDVTEIYVPLVPIPDSALVTFKSEPTGARVILAGGNFSGLNDELAPEIEHVLADYEGTAENAVVTVQNLLNAETVPPLKVIVGLVGTTPFEMELHEGSYMYRYFLDGYSMEDEIGTFDVDVGQNKLITETLIPDVQFVQVYFETSVDDEGGAQVSVDGEVKNTTPCWVYLPSNQIVDVTFDQMPLYAPKVVTVDTTLFEGRPSKWGDVIKLDLMTYYLTTYNDAHSTISPSGVIPVSAGDTKIFNLNGEAPAWLVDNLTVVRDGLDPIVYNYNQVSVEYPHTKTLENATLTVSSTKKKVAINATVTKGGSVNYPGITWWEYGQPSDTFNFTALDGYVFDKIWVDRTIQWNNNLYDFSASQMVENHTLHGIFRPENVYINPLSTEGGRMLDGAELATPYWIPYGGNTRMHEAVSDPGYRFVSFHDEREPMEFIADADRYFYGPVGPMTTNATITAIFEPLNFTINSRAEEGGIISPVLTNYTAEYGEELSFTATPFAGYQLAEFTDNGISKGTVNPYNITVTEDHEIIAHFQTDVLTITAVAGEGGKIEPNGSVNVTFGESQCFNITAFVNYYISSVEIDGEDIGNQTSPFQYCFDNITTDHIISANFTQYAYTITPSAGVGGTITPSTPQTVPIGESKTFTITPNGCYTIKDVKVDEVSQGPVSTYTFTNVTEDHSIHAEFQIKKYSIEVNQSVGGVIEPEGTDGILEVNCGSTQCFNMTPDAGNILYDVIVDGISVGAENPYCFIDIQSNHSIEPVFVIPPEPEFEADRVRVPPSYPVTFRDLTRNNPTDWLWDFGDGQITDIREPVHYFAEVGNYTITLTAYNAAALDGVKIVKENYIEVTTNPIAGFIARPVGGIVPNDVKIEFIDTSLNTNGAIFGWKYGNGEGSNSKNATYNYTAPGVYQITHKVEKPFTYTDYAYETITILQKPVADFMAHPVSGKAPLTVQFVDKSQGFPTSWFWDFGDTVKSYDQNPVHVYSDAGSYNVTLSVFSDEGSSVKTKNGFITVQSLN